MAKKSNNPIMLPTKDTRKNSALVEDAEAWMYEERHGLTVLVQVPIVGTISQRIPWRVIEGCVKRYRADKRKKPKRVTA